MRAPGYSPSLLVREKNRSPSLLCDTFVGTVKRLIKAAAFVMRACRGLHHDAQTLLHGSVMEITHLACSGFRCESSRLTLTLSKEAE